MPRLARPGALLHYDDTGDGDLVVMVHGLTENALYWSVPGIAGRMSDAYRVASLELRAHGRSAAAGGFDVRTLGDDVLALADHLGAGRFHLVSHSTGGMVAVRLAWRLAGEGRTRLASLVLTDTGAATWPGREDPRQAMAPLFEGRTWDEVIERVRRSPGLFLSQVDVHPRRDHLWALYEAMVRVGDPDSLARFIRCFYDDPDPHAEELRRIDCPTLVLLGEHDRLFVRPSRQLADEIPDAELVVLPGVGHMTAFEAPEETYRAIRRFVDAHPVGDRPAARARSRGPA